jgi:hypothetical protein
LSDSIRSALFFVAGIAAYIVLSILASSCKGCAERREKMVDGLVGSDGGIDICND